MLSVFPDTFRLCHLSLRHRREGEGSLSFPAVSSYVLLLGALGLGVFHVWKNTKDKQVTVNY